MKHTPLQFLPFDVLQNVGDDNAEEKPFLLSVFNHATSGAYRSPHTSRLFTVQDHKVSQIAPPKPLSEDDRELRNLEKAMNEVWYAYTALYYGFDSVGSVFLTKPGHTAKRFDTVESVALSKTRSKGYMEGMFGVQKRAEGNDVASWDCVHIVHVEEQKDKMCNYRVESAVVMTISPYTGSKISSSLQKETNKTLPVRPATVGGSHIENLGKIIEDVETEFRSKLERVDIPKTIDVVESMYNTGRDSVTASLITGIDESEEPMMTTGMGVGSTMIGEIATMANQKKAEGNSFLDRMKDQQNAKDAQMAVQNQDYLTETRSQLKSPTPVPKASVMPPMTPPPDFVGGKLALKRTSGLPLKAPLSPASPTPEFADFRNKLKKAGAK